MGDNNWSYSKIYKEIKPYEEYGMYDVAWHDGMSAADGHIGVITSCAPLNDSFIFQNVEYIMPSEEPRYVPLEVGGQLDEARQSVINMDVYRIYTTENVPICIVIIRTPAQGGIMQEC